MKKGVYWLYTHLSATQRGNGLLRMIGDHVSKHTELSTDSKPLSYPFRLLVEKSELLRQRPEHAKMPDDIRAKTRPYFGMTVPPVAERRERPRSESTYHWLTSAVFEMT
ncbi:MAG TPA: hypothetical protein VFQ43_06850 [Nitrososphaera sp.]|nr:hypothetical protein [Nitrososphaera sp.]